MAKKAKKQKPPLPMPALNPKELYFTIRFVAGLLVPIVRFMFGVRAKGAEKLPKDGAFIIVGNHVTNVDALAVAYWVYMQLGRAPHFLAKESLFRLPFFGQMLRRAGQIPVYRSGRSNDEPLRVAVQYLEAGQVVCIFPEGTLTRDPDLWPMRGKPGAVRLALQTGVPVYPIGQWGSEKVLPQYGAKFRPGLWKKVDIIVGDEVNLDAYRGRTLGNNELSEATAVVMARITELVEVLRGEKAPNGAQWDPEEHGQPVTGNFKKEGK